MFRLSPLTPPTFPPHQFVITQLSSPRSLAPNPTFTCSSRLPIHSSTPLPAIRSRCSPPQSTASPSPAISHSSDLIPPFQHYHPIHFPFLHHPAVSTVSPSSYPRSTTITPLQSPTAQQPLQQPRPTSFFTRTFPTFTPSIHPPFSPPLLHHPSQIAIPPSDHIFHSPVTTPTQPEPPPTYSITAPPPQSAQPISIPASPFLRTSLHPQPSSPPVSTRIYFHSKPQQPTSFRLASPPINLTHSFLHHFLLPPASPPFIFASSFSSQFAHNHFLHLNQTRPHKPNLRSLHQSSLHLTHHSNQPFISLRHSSSPPPFIRLPLPCLVLLLLLV